MALARRRQPAAMDWAGKGRDPSCAWSGRECAVGPVGQESWEARVESGGRLHSGGICALHRFSVYYGCDYTGGGSEDVGGDESREGREDQGGGG
jgi:hypothetical protein